MSVLDQLSDLERQVVDRLRELEPLVGEYEQLRKVAGRLGVEYEPRSGTRDGNQPAPGPRRGATARSKSGQRNSASRSAGAAARPTTRARKSSTAAGTARRAARRRAPAPAGQREQQMLALVGERPGITVAEIAERLGVD